MNIPICKPSLPEINDYVSSLERVWESKMLSNNAFYAQRLEEIVRTYLKVKYACVVNNADTGLIIALSSLELPTKSEVIIPSFTFNSTANAVLWNNLTPVFADINLDTFCINTEDIEAKITKKTKAIIATHIFGNPCGTESLENLAKKYKLKLIFDSAHAYGSKIESKKVGNFGNIEVFSFSGTKIVTSGEGGVITTNDQKLYKKFLLSRNYGFGKDYISKRVGINGKISELNAILGCLNLPNVEKLIDIRSKISLRYKNILTDVGDLNFQFIPEENESTFQSFPILTNKRDHLAKHLESKGVQTKKYFYPLHKMKFFNTKLNLPNTEEVFRKIICLPIYADLKSQDQDKIIDIIVDFYKS